MEELKIWIYFWSIVVIVFIILWIITNHKKNKNK